MRAESGMLSPDPELDQEQGAEQEQFEEEGKERSVEIDEYLSKEFLELEKLADGIVVDEGDTVAIAGVKVEKKDLEPALAERLKQLQEHAHGILGKTARRILKAGRNAALAGVLTIGYTALDINKQVPFANREQAQRELQENGIPSDQRLSAYKAGISELLYEGITPLGYQNKPSTEEGNFGKDFFAYLQKRGVPNAGMLQEFGPNVILGREDRGKTIERIRKDTSLDSSEKEKAYHQQAWGSIESVDRVLGHSQMPHLDDAWRMYLGLPQKDNTFGISDFQPKNSKDDKYYYKINGFWNDFASFLKDRDWYLDKDFQEFVDAMKGEARNQEELEKAVDDWVMSDKEKQIGEYIKKGIPLPEGGMKGYIEFLRSQPGQKIAVESETRSGEHKEDIMFHYTVACGQDEKGYYIAYYDKWDLASFFAENPLTRGVGRPFEIYDRLYYDPTTFEIIK